ncbi:MAG: O-succinylbenzoate--CoA ligase [Sulfobacillus benefaciens]|uniref:O-succinylbenzoate--CoA ligase n=1 Tax=Sulfobacillus benefaciens TaxID=453960 RepID=A0A2T2XJ79_9FIRM|nr:MAG: O-succinylbenzoate--CoA ligase [Sulfobacillus benefaciens]
MVTSSDYFFEIPSELRSYLQGYTMPAVFDAVVAQRGDHPAAFEGECVYTWKQWQDDARALALALGDLGVRTGDVVGVHLPNSWEFLVAHVAIALQGAVMLPLHMAHAEREISALLERTGARFLIAPTQYRGHEQSTLSQHLVDNVESLEKLLVVGDGLEPHPDTVHFDLMLQQGRGRQWTPVPIKPEDPFVLVASSGTTSSRPKICLHSHDGLLSNAWATAKDGLARPDDIILSGSPFTHLFGMLSVHISLLMGSGQSLMSRWNADDCLKRAQDTQSTIVFAVPTQVRDLLGVLDRKSRQYRLGVREIRTGGAAVPKELVMGVREKLNAGVIIQWGMSEVGSGIFTRPVDPDEVASSSVGVPVLGAEVRILSDGQPTLVGESGELYYRSPYMFHGYYGELELTTESVDSEGWLHTGDLASWNHDGTVQYRGRRTEMINRGGLKFSALEVESLLSDMPELAQHAIMPRPDQRLGEKACLVVAFVPGRSITLDEVCRHLSDKGLAKYKWPEELVVLEALPTTPTGKIARARLKEAVSAVDQI